MSLHRTIAVLGTGALILSATACSSDDKGSTSTAKSGGGSTVTLKVGQTGWATVQAALKVAGLDNTPYKVQYAVFPGGDKQLEALKAGAVDVGNASDIPPVFAAGAGKPDFKVVAVQRATTLQQEVIVNKGSSITGIAQLKGKKVGYVPNTTAQYFLVKLLEQNGLTWKDIKPAPLAPNDGVAALHGGSIDALASYGNSIITLHQQGARTIGSGRDILSGNFPWATTDGVLGDPKKKAALVDLLVRYTKAFAYIRNGHEQQYADQIAAATHQPADQALAQLKEQEGQRQTQIVPTTPQAIAAEQSVADVFTGLGAIPAKVDVAGYWTDTLNTDLTNALKAAGLPTGETT
jgi:sulfonate transport system substrate-binding protein